MKQLDGYSSDIFAGMLHFDWVPAIGNKLTLAKICHAIRFYKGGEIL